MKVQQLKYIAEVARCGLNISSAAEALNTAQPGVSNQIRLLEEELDIEIFERKGKRLVGVTEPGRVVIQMAERVLREMDNIRNVCREFKQTDSGTLAIATTHTQARYILPEVIKQFTQAFPKVKLRMHQGNPQQIADMVATGVADIAIATEAIEEHEDLIMLPCYEWNRCVVAPLEHPVLSYGESLTLEQLSAYPIVTYDFAFSGRSMINQAFDDAGLQANVVFTAIDADVIKTYVSLGLGIGIIASMAYDADRDHALGMVDAGKLFEPSVTRIGLRRGMFLRRYMYAFIELFAPHLKAETVRKAMRNDSELGERVVKSL